MSTSPPPVVDLAALTRLAHHARLLPADLQDPRWQHDLRGIVETLDALEAAAELPSAAEMVAGPPPMTMASLRQDVVRPSLSTAEALRNAPQPLGDGFGVPPVLATGRSR